MKFKSYLSFTAAALLGVLVLGACGDDEYADVYGERENAVYINNGDRSYTIVHLPDKSVSSLNYKLELHCNHKAASDFTATVIIDNSLIAQYNKEHETEYAELPSGILNIENKTVNFKKGTFVSSDVLHITATSNLKSCTNEKGYLLPIRIESVSGSGVKLADTSTTAYVAIEVMDDDDNLSDVKTVPFGETVDDRSGWNAIVPDGTTVSTNTQISAEPNNMFNSEKNYEVSKNLQYWWGRWSEQELPVVIDLGKLYTFDGLIADYNKSGFVDMSSWSDGDLIEISDNQSTWQKVGNVKKDPEIWKTVSTQAFHTAVTARYIRITVYNTGWNVQFQCGNFNIYELKN